MPETSRHGRYEHGLTRAAPIDPIADPSSGQVNIWVNGSKAQPSARAPSTIEFAHAGQHCSLKDSMSDKDITRCLYIRIHKYLIG
jgi:hypothetical protein